MTSLPAPIDPSQLATVTDAIVAELQSVIVGQQELVHLLLVSLLCEGHVLIEGVPGVGKTESLKALAGALGLQVTRAQFTPDLMPADLVGTQVLTEGPGGRSVEFRAGPVFTNLLLADEINRATPKTQSALLEAMAERQVTVAGETRALPRPFLVMATQNPLEMDGTYPLPEAQLDRFLLKVLVPFPSASELAEVLQRTTSARLRSVRAVTDGATVAAMVQLTRQVPISPVLIDQVVRLVLCTHPAHPSAPEVVRRYVRFGASPRGAQGIVMAAKATALLRGRPNVAETDILAVAPAVLRHRLVVGYEAIADGVSADELVEASVSAAQAFTGRQRHR